MSPAHEKTGDVVADLIAFVRGQLVELGRHLMICDLESAQRFEHPVLAVWTLIEQESGLLSVIVRFGEAVEVKSEVPQDGLVLEFDDLGLDLSYSTLAAAVAQISPTISAFETLQAMFHVAHPRLMEERTRSMGVAA